MAAQAFISFFEKNSKNYDFNYQTFNYDVLVQLSPNKIAICYLNNINETVFQFRNVIVSNLGLNPYFCKDHHRTSNFERFYKLLVETEDKIESENQIAQLTLLVHFSKSLIKFKTRWDYFFHMIPSLKMASEEFIFKKDIEILFNQINSNKKINEKLCELVMSLSGLNEVKFNFEDLKLDFFEIDVNTLNGFAGVNNVYIGIRSIERFVNELPKAYSEEQKEEILKINVTRLVIHESFHVVLRKVLNNFNAPSTKLSNKQVNKDVLIEGGVKAEKAFFTERIEWVWSSQMPQFDLGYCVNFLNKLINATEELPRFDFIRSGCVPNTRELTYMAIDYDGEYVEFE